MLLRYTYVHNSIVNTAKKKLRTFENKVWKKICGLVVDVVTEIW